MKNKRSEKKKALSALLFLLSLTGALLTGCDSKDKQVQLTQVYLNGRNVGKVADEKKAESLFLEARKQIARTSDRLVLMDVTLTCEEDETLYDAEDAREQVINNMKAVMQESIVEKPEKSYTIKMDEYMVNVESVEAVQELLQAVVNKYDASGDFQVALVQDHTRDLKVSTAKVEKLSGDDKNKNGLQLLQTGFGQAFEEYYEEADIEGEKGFEDYQYGITNMDFSELVEVVEAYLPPQQVTRTQKAIEDVTKEQETKSFYKVLPGDTLSEIAIKVNIPMDKIVEMNDSLDSSGATIRVDQELVITVPEPEVSLNRNEINYYEEIYDAPVVYIDRDDWYTTDSHVIQQPSAGFRKIAVSEDYVNDKLVNREILREEVVMDAVEKIVERGTKIPPTYIKPINGGRFTSGFGKRKAPTKGASTYHKGIDWATPVGTAVYASCGGKVSKAGWGSGYGNVIYIDHEDGRQTRYGHLSKVLVSVGDKVKQGEKIALSGNTGVSTGPHIHFEILIDGSQVNPFSYLD